MFGSGVTSRESRSARNRIWTGWDPAEVAIFLAFALLASWTLALLLKHVIADGAIWTGSDGLHVSDQMQYIAWIRQASQHLLISNPYRLSPTPATFLQPGILISGLLVALGMSPTLAYLLWAPVAALCLFFAVRAYVHRTVPGVSGQRAAIVLGLFFVSTAAYLSGTLGINGANRLYLLALSFDMWPGSWLWGYAFTVLAVAAIPAALLFYERDRRAGRTGLTAPAIGMLSSWFQPWQGATLLCTVMVTELVLLGASRGPLGRRLDRKRFTARLRVPAIDRRVLALLAVTVSATAAPLAYYTLLGHFDPSWSLANSANKLSAWPVAIILATIAPLALPAVLAYRLGPVTFQQVAVRAWPLVGLGLYWITALTHVGTFPIHFFQGLTIPLAILAVIGVSSHVRIRRPFGALAAAGAVALLTVPAVAWELDGARSTVDASGSSSDGPPNPYFLTAGESQALAFVRDDKRPGGVLTPLYLGQMIPAQTGRRTWVGAISWTPDFSSRVAVADRLFDGGMSASQAVAFVRSTSARYVVVDCQHRADMASLLAPIVRDIRRFGCASVLYVSAH